MFKQLGLDKLAEKCSPNQGIHHLSNVLTMAEHLCTLFDDLALWLEPTAVEHQVSAFSNQVLFDYSPYFSTKSVPRTLQISYRSTFRALQHNFKTIHVQVSPYLVQIC